MSTPCPPFVFFGGEPLGVPVLERLSAHGLVPSLVVASPDRPAGRKQLLTPPPVKVWAQAHHIPVFQPESYKDRAGLSPLFETESALFVVVAYNFILPEWLITHPPHQTINLHPSMLPLYRGPSPIRTAILEDNPEAVGVSVMLMDSEMDHGPLLAQEKYQFSAGEWPANGPKLDAALADFGGNLLADTIPKWLSGDIQPVSQDHSRATYTKKFTKAMAQLELDPFNLPRGEAARQAYLKILAFAGSPVAFFIHDGVRYKITAARMDHGTLVIESLIPEGKPELPFERVFG